MGQSRPFIGRSREMRAAAEALRARRGVLLTGPARSGRTQLLSAIVRGSARTPYAVEMRAGVVTARSAHGDRRPLADGDDVAELVAEAAARAGIVVVDDIDLLPDATVVALVDALTASDAVFLVTLAPRHEIARRSIDRWEALRPLVEDGDGLSIAVGAFTLVETATLANELRAVRHGTGPADDAWVMALHQVSGGSPALIHDLVEVAAVRGRLRAVCPIEPFSDLLPGALVETVGRLLAPLDDRERHLLGIVFDLGAVPLDHIAWIVPSDVLGRFHDGNLLVAAVEAGTAAVSPLLARVIRESAPRVHHLDARRDVALRLLELTRGGDVLTPVEEMFCARFAGTPDPAGPLAEPMSALLPRAALSLARSGVPRDALPVISRILDDGPDLRATAALILTRIALEEYGEAEQLLDLLPPPATIAERELGLHVSVRVLCATCAGIEPARDRIRSLEEWAPDDEGWRTRVAHAAAMLALPNGASFAERSPLASPPDGPGPDPADVDDALGAALAASLGDAARARVLLGRRQATHGWDVETDLTMFLLHAYTMVLIGEELPVIEGATRRRLLSARWGDRQDEVAVLALLDACVQLQLGRPDVAFSSLLVPRITPPESLRVWYEAIRAIALIDRGDLVHAAEALERIDAAAAGWSGGAFSVLRETVCARFEVANRRFVAAATRAGRAIDEAERHMPSLLPALLRILVAAGEPIPQVRERAAALTDRFDLEPLRAFLAEVPATARPEAVPGLDLLTSREREVVDRAVTGESNAQIARSLGVSVRTVESHLHHARTRLGMGRHERFAQLAGATGVLAPR